VTVRRLAAGGLVGIGVCTALFAGLTLLSPAWFQARIRPVLPPVEAIERLAAPPPGGPIGVLEVPRLGLSSVVLEGDDQAALLFGVGHLPDTPLPWDEGNSVLAAHRDSFFRPLRHIRRNDIIRFATAEAAFEYVVRDTRVVEPTNLDVLDPTPSPTLTLITCYPFNYIGPAPLRFIVRAERREPRLSPRQRVASATRNGP
jgi:sortase A